MQKVIKLNLGSNDAENYKRRDQKEYFNKIFLKDDNFEKILDPGNFFLIGEKGTGKTAYAVFLSNNFYGNTKSSVKYVRETEYRKFIELKKNKHLQLSDYQSIWSVILLVMLAKEISEKEIDSVPFKKSKKIKAIRKAIDEYYAYAFSPEISKVITIVDESKLAAELFAQYAKIGSESSQKVSFTEERFQINLQYLLMKLKDALADLKMVNNHYLFIDGIDFRPHNIPYQDYLECVKGLANSIWQLNNDYFSNIKDSKGRFKIVLLLRPDIFDSIGFQNSSNKIFNNSVFLDWRTDYNNFMKSNLMQVADKILSSQQSNFNGLGECWNHYFSWKSNATSPNRDFDPAYIDLLKISLSRPRDILTIMILLQEEMKQANDSNICFTKKYFESYSFKNAYSEYLLSNIKDQLSFYYTQEDWEIFLRFFSLFNSKIEFKYEEYLAKYNEFLDIIFEKAKNLPEFIDTPEMFLQFLYDTNIICYIEDIEYNNFFRWCYRERNSTNIKPKVKLGLRYRFHYGLHKILNLGVK